MAKKTRRTALETIETNIAVRIMLGVISFVSMITPELIVSIGILISTVAGVLIAYIKLKPGLRVQILRCTHQVVGHRNRRRKRKAGTRIEAKFKILNTGARTSIHKVGVYCKTSGPPFQNSEEVQSQHLIVIEKGEIVEYTHKFDIHNREVFETPLLSTFFLYHTYGKKKVKAKSISQPTQWIQV